MWYFGVMSVIEMLLGDVRRAAIKTAPSLAVILAVMLLLRGFWGSVAAIKLQLAMLAGSLLGAGDGLTGVLLHTLPLAIAAGLATFAIASGTLKFESFTSIVVLACIILLGTSVGGFLRQFVPDARNDEPIAITSTSRQIVDTPPPSIPLGIPIGVKSAGNPGGSFSSPLGIEISRTNLVSPLSPNMDSSGLDDLLGKPSTPQSPWQQLGEIQWFAEPNLSKAAPREIPPLNLLPKPGGIAGIVTRAINQVCGYLVSYQPRLFLAAVIAGSWIGWSWTRRLRAIHQRVIEANGGVIKVARNQQQTPVIRKAA